MVRSPPDRKFVNSARLAAMVRIGVTELSRAANKSGETLRRLSAAFFSADSVVGPESSVATTQLSCCMTSLRL